VRWNIGKKATIQVRHTKGAVIHIDPDHTHADVTVLSGWKGHKVKGRFLGMGTISKSYCGYCLPAGILNDVITAALSRLQ
jgi:hypothetical protein